MTLAREHGILQVLGARTQPEHAETKMATTLDREQMKDLLKEAITELVQEREDILHDLVSDIVEDIALARAIREGLGSGRVSRDEVFRVLEAKP